MHRVLNSVCIQYYLAAEAASGRIVFPKKHVYIPAVSRRFGHVVATGTKGGEC